MVCALCAVVVLAGCAAPVRQEPGPSAGVARYVWWEAESARATNFDRNPKDNPRVREVMSGGTWIGVEDPRPGADAFLEYDVTAPETAEYEFLARKFWHHGPFRWRFDDQAWQQVDNRKPLLDSVELWTHWGANWVPCGFVRLSKGRHTLRVEVTSPSGPAYFDAFVLTRDPFVARGKLKPNDPFPSPPAGWFTFAPTTDPDSPAELDLRVLNEKVAGEKGWVRADGERLLFGDGTPARFWAMNAGGEAVAMPRPYVDRLARFLAKRGYNLVRLHGGIYIRSGPNAGDVDRQQLDNLLYAVAALRKQGVYVTLSIHFQHWIDLGESKSIAGYPAGKLPFAIHYFDEKYQAMYRSWFEALLTTPNPYIGGAKLADTPSVATVELLNEDSFFFWTFGYENIPAPYMRALERRFGAWLTDRYGSLERALTAWAGKTVPQDALGEGRMGFVSVWEMFNDRGKRSQDTVRFLAEVQREFYARHRDYVKKDLGYKGLVTCSNWTTASERYLHQPDHWTNLVGDLMDSHGYFAGARKKVSPAFGQQIGDAFADRALVRLDPADPADPAKPVSTVDMPFMDTVFAGKPSMVSEWGWVGPNRFRAEAPLMVSAIAAQNGMDAQIGFSVAGQPAWVATCNDYFSAATPVEMGQSPAAALIFRRGYVRESEPVAHIAVNIEDMLSLKGSPAFGGNLQDFVRAVDGAPQGAQAAGAPDLNPAILAAGKVVVEIGAGASGVKLSPKLGDLVRPSEGIIAGSTGGFVWDTRRGLFRLTAPHAQGAAGFLAAAGRMAFADTVVESPMEFGSIAVVSLDGLPLARSARIFVQVASEQANHGWRQEGGPLREIKDLGTMPIEVRRFAGSVGLKRADAGALAVTALDYNGRRTKQVGRASGFALLPDAPYYVIESPVRTP